MGRVCYLLRCPVTNQNYDNDNDNEFISNKGPQKDRKSKENTLQTMIKYD